MAAMADVTHITTVSRNKPNVKAAASWRSAMPFQRVDVTMIRPMEAARESR